MFVSSVTGSVMAYPDVVDRNRIAKFANQRNHFITFSFRASHQPFPVLIHRLNGYHSA